MDPRGRCLKAATSQHDSPVLPLKAPVWFHNSPEAGVGTGFSYKMAIGIMQNILQVVIKANKHKHYFKMLVEASQIPKNTSEKDPSVPF